MKAIITTLTALVAIGISMKKQADFFLVRYLKIFATIEAIVVSMAN